MQKLPPDFSHSAAYYLFRLNTMNGTAQVLHLRAADYRNTAFLDERLLQTGRFGGWQVGLEELRARSDSDGARDSVNWLFHIGHCGSTLVSRLLDFLPGVLGVREPLPLLELAGLWPEIDRPLAGGMSSASFDDLLALVRRLLARGFPDTSRVVVKPTSVVSALAPRLIGPDDRACLLWIDLESWLATMLRDPGLRADARRSAPVRLPGWHALSGEDALGIPALGDPELLAMCWLTEQWRWQRLRAEPGRGARLLDLNFEDFLRDPQACLGTFARHFRIDDEPQSIPRALASDLMQRYAKDPRQAFDAQIRRRELAAAREQFAAEVERGLQWAGNAARRFDLTVCRERMHTPLREP